MGDYPVLPDPEIRSLQRQKLQLETESLRLQMNEFREKSRREKEKYRLETEKMKHELLVLKLKAKEVKARTEYFVAAKKSIHDKEANGNPEQQKNGPEEAAGKEDGFMGDLKVEMCHNLLS